MSKPIFLFDGVCNLCNGWVNYVIDKDPDARVQLGALQSDEGQRVMREYNIPESYLESVVLVENGVVYTQSTAILRLAGYLTGAVRWLKVFLIVPSFIRDIVYRFIARFRYSWFGKASACRLPTPEIEKHFLKG